MFVARVLGSPTGSPAEIIPLDVRRDVGVHSAADEQAPSLIDLGPPGTPFPEGSVAVPGEGVFGFVVVIVEVEETRIGHRASHDRRSAAPRIAATSTPSERNHARPFVIAPMMVRN